MSIKLIYGIAISFALAISNAQCVEKKTNEAERLALTKLGSLEVDLYNKIYNKLRLNSLKDYSVIFENDAGTWATFDKLNKDKFLDKYNQLFAANSEKTTKNVREFYKNWVNRGLSIDSIKIEDGIEKNSKRKDIGSELKSLAVSIKNLYAKQDDFLKKLSKKHNETLEDAVEQLKNDKKIQNAIQRVNDSLRNICRLLRIDLSDTNHTTAQAGSVPTLPRKSPKLMEKIENSKKMSSENSIDGSLSQADGQQPLDDTRKNLLSSIREGKQLKKVTEEELQKSNAESSNNKGDLEGMLKHAMKKRRKDIKNDDEYLNDNQDDEWQD